MQSCRDGQKFFKVITIYSFNWINIFENLNFEENDFFSYSGLTKNGSRKVSEYILRSLD